MQRLRLQATELDTEEEEAAKEMAGGLPSEAEDTPPTIPYYPQLGARKPNIVQRLKEDIE
jgi:hypothetical protein